MVAAVTLLGALAAMPVLSRLTPYRQGTRLRPLLVRRVSTAG